MDKLSATRAADYLGIRADTLRRAANENRVRHEWIETPFGRMRLYPVDGLDEYRERQRLRLSAYGSASRRPVEVA